ncbi:hypothetical protein FSHL1_009675 [Fusarium sambucinum]
MASHFSQYQVSHEELNRKPMPDNPPVQKYSGAPGTNTQNATDNMTPNESVGAMSSPALPPRPNQHSDDHLKKQLHDLHQNLAAEVSKNEQYRDLLIENKMIADELNQSLSDTRHEVEEYKALWKQSASDLNSHLVNDRGFKSLDDKFFVDEVTLLRRNIRDFSYQYYDNWPADIKTSSNSVREIAKPSLDLSQEEHEERNRQIDLWRARTSTLLQDPLSLRQSNKHRESQEKSFKELTNHLVVLLPPNVKTRDLSEQVSAIWAGAVRLDMVMNTQASGLHLYYRHRKDRPLKFDSAKMEEESEGDDSQTSEIVTCVLAPALGRRGEADGTRLAERAYLLKMLVSCQSGDKRTRGQQKPEEKDHARPGMMRAAAANIRNRFNINS